MYASLCKRGSAFGFSGEEPVKKRVGWSIAALCVLAVAFAGFASYQSSYSTPYATPVVEALAAGDDGTFDGLLKLAETSPRSSTVKVLWTHGMCTHPPSWVDGRMQRLVDAVGGTAETVSVRASETTARRCARSESRRGARRSR